MASRAAPASGPPLYLDHHATTPVDPRVLDVMDPFFSERFGNAASRTHAYGWSAEAAVEVARAHGVALIGAGPREIVFTSGATESDNLAIKGVALRAPSARRHLVTSSIEHKAVLDSVAWLAGQGWDVTYVDPCPDGVVSAAEVASALRDDTALVSVMAVNNEVGVIQEISEIGTACAARGALFHSDAAQAVGRVPVDVRASGVHLLSLSGHKMYGPKGIGALYVRRRDPKVRLTPLVHGGGHEQGMRSGTLNVPGIVGLGEAARIAAAELAEDGARLDGLRATLLAGLRSQLPDLHVHGEPAARVPGSLNVSLPGVDAEAMMLALKDDVAMSSGSACMSATLEPSYVLRAMGVGEDVANTSLRLGLGRRTTPSDVDFAIRRICEEALRLRAMTPSWRMAAEG